MEYPSGRRSLKKYSAAPKRAASSAAREAAMSTRSAARMARRFKPVPSYSGYGPVITGKLTSKYKDLAYATYNCDTTGSITLIPNAITVGAGENERVGAQIILKSLWIRGQFASGTTTTITDGVAYIVWDRSPNKVMPAITDILDTVSSDSFPRDSNRRRFTILKKLQFTGVGNRATPTTGMELQNVEEYIKLPNLVTEYSAGGTGTITDIQTGALLFVTCGNSAAGTTAGALSATFRTRYINP